MSLMISLTYGQDGAGLPSLESQPPPAIETPSSDQSVTPSNRRKKIVYREKSYFEFEDTLVNGNLRAPDGSFVFRKSPSTFSSALGLRRSFIPELKASAQDAR